MESLTENKALMYSILGSAGAVLALAMGVVPDVAYQFEIVDFPPDVSAASKHHEYAFYIQLRVIHLSVHCHSIVLKPKQSGKLNRSWKDNALNINVIY